MPEATRSETPRPEALADAFWAFSLDFYARPGIADACLRLQDAHGLDVNLVLFCCWLARSGHGRLSAAALIAAEARVAPWRDAVLAPLRAARCALKTMPVAGAATLYAEVKRVELAAEREEQRLLLASCAGAPVPTSDRAADEAANLALYVAARGLPAETLGELISALPAMG